MRIAFVTKVKEKDLKKVFPWMKRMLPFLGGFILIDAVKASAPQRELMLMAKKEIQRGMEMERRHAAWEKKLKQSKGRPIMLRADFTPTRRKRKLKVYP